MPKITISEKDSTLISVNDVTENVVYVPGIAKLKPNKTKYKGIPTVYDNVQEFLADFEPYKFKEEQKYPATSPYITIPANTWEKSFIYATELLQAGLKVLYENVIDATAYPQSETTYTLTNVGTVSQETFEADSYVLLAEAQSVTAENFNDGVYYISQNQPTNTIFKLAETYSSQVTYFTITEATVWQADTTYYTESINTTNDDSSLLKDFYDKIYPGQTSQAVSVLDKLQDKWTYNFKYLSLGSYPALYEESITPTGGTAEKRYPIVEMMSMIAAVRGETIALIDDKETTNAITTLYNNLNTNITSSIIESYYTMRKNQSGTAIDNIKYSTGSTRLEEITLKYATIVVPYATYYTMVSVNTANSITVKLPGSFAYLTSLANSINTYKNPDYYAIAGVVRGKILNITDLVAPVSGAEADAVQVRTKEKISLNPIVNVQGYGLCIWGNRTLYPNAEPTDVTQDGQLTASSFLNIRVLVADVKKVIYATCKKYTFETNSTELWLKFKSDITPTLEKMIANGGLEDYELTRNTTTERATLSVNVKLVTLYAVEDFDVTIELTDSTVEQAQ